MSAEERQAQIDRAVARSAEQAAAGNQPILIRSGRQPTATISHWYVMSRRTAGQHYGVVATRHYADGSLETGCSCPARAVCWHRAHVRAAIRREIPHIDARRQDTQAAD